MIGFLRGTAVTMADGTRRPIDEVEAGDELLAWDPELRALVPALVMETFQRWSNGPRQLVRINGQLVAAAQHPIYTDDGWRPAIQLQLGEILLCDAGVDLGLRQLELVPSDEPIYHLRLRGEPGNYFAGSILVAAGDERRVERAAAAALPDE